MSPIINKPIAITIHGFLGSKDDFNFLDKEFKIHSFDIKPQEVLIAENQRAFESWTLMIDRLWLYLKHLLNEASAFEKESEVFIFSYSMGSKALFAVLDKYGKEIQTKKINLVLLSTHFGLYDNDLAKEKEKEFRTDMNSKFLKIINDHDVDQFLIEWSKLSLFSADGDKTLKTTWTKNQIEHYFKFWNQSQFVDQDSRLLSYKFVQSIFVFVGQQDLKYKSQATQFKNVCDLNKLNHIHFYEIPKRSHRILRDSDLDFIIKNMQILNL